MRYFWIIIAAGIVCFSVSVCGSSVSADEKNGLGITPATVSVDIQDPGSSETVKFVIRNNSAAVMTVALQLYDFRPYGEDGNIRFVPRITQDTYQYSLSSFITLETPELIIEPRSERHVTARIENREDISPGGHYAALVARDVTGGEKNTSPLIQPAVVSSIFVRKVGGERFNLSIKNVNWPSGSIVFSLPDSIIVLFQNAGNIHLVPFGTLTISDMWGRRITEGYLNSGSTKVYPESRRKVPVSIAHTRWVFPVSLLYLEVSGQDSLKKTRYTYRDSFIFINPGILSVTLVVCVVSVWYWKKRTQK